MKVNHIALDHKHQHDERPQLSIEKDFSTKAKKKRNLLKTGIKKENSKTLSN